MWPCSTVTWGAVSHRWLRCQSGTYLGIWVWFSDWYSLWAAFLPRSQHQGGLSPVSPVSVCQCQCVIFIGPEWSRDLNTGCSLADVPCVSVSHLTQQLRLGSAPITNTKPRTETTGMIRNTKYVNSKPAPRFRELLGWIFLAFCTLNLMLGW